MWLFTIDGTIDWQSASHSFAFPTPPRRPPPMPERGTTVGGLGLDGHGNEDAQKPPSFPPRTSSRNSSRNGSRTHSRRGSVLDVLTAAGAIPLRTTTSRESARNGGGDEYGLGKPDSARHVDGSIDYELLSRLMVEAAFGLGDRFPDGQNGPSPRSRRNVSLPPPPRSPSLERRRPPPARSPSSEQKRNLESLMNDPLMTDLLKMSIDEEDDHKYGSVPNRPSAEADQRPTSPFIAPRVSSAGASAEPIDSASCSPSPQPRGLRRRTASAGFLERAGRAQPQSTTPVPTNLLTLVDGAATSSRSGSHSPSPTSYGNPYTPPSFGELIQRPGALCAVLECRRPPRRKPNMFGPNSRLATDPTIGSLDESFANFQSDLADGVTARGEDGEASSRSSTSTSASTATSSSGTSSPRHSGTYQDTLFQRPARFHSRTRSNGSTAMAASPTSPTSPTMPTSALGGWIPRLVLFDSTNSSNAAVYLFSVPATPTTLPVAVLHGFGTPFTFSFMGSADWDDPVGIEHFASPPNTLVLTVVELSFEATQTWQFRSTSRRSFGATPVPLTRDDIITDVSAFWSLIRNPEPPLATGPRTPPLTAGPSPASSHNPSPVPQVSLSSKPARPLPPIPSPRADSGASTHGSMPRTSASPPPALLPYDRPSLEARRQLFQEEYKRFCEVFEKASEKARAAAPPLPRGGGGLGGGKATAALRAATAAAAAATGGFDGSTRGEEKEYVAPSRAAMDLGARPPSLGSGKRLKSFTIFGSNGNAAVASPGSKK
ncbi:hypothetical protein DFJ73DRAFT_13347 [Zopfochytrium polystomum]|nr:hypothetical protein DFJ73DRAFT_13347 [Zopfochytrium polystomum]